ncbi:MAG: ATP-dependent Clp protease proteolytic subunit [Clostridiales bacterium]|jgi:ATP-dependent protease ClpP protease subunit|nr:ATP-dependent Clp protease proteolytic subunit [Clostridiales bacterium]MDR2749986.1 ATP-dependent Clp protease proteolytic subunit [Clostridiales bacterium]
MIALESDESKSPDKKEQENVTSIQAIKELGVPSLQPISNPRGSIQFLSIIGQVEGHVALPPQNKTTKYEHVIPQLFAAAENPNVDGMLVLLNTVGGDVEAGLAIAELISHFGKPTVSLVVGGGHSIGVPLAVAADYSFIAPSATMTIHPVRLNGTIVGAPQTYDYFEKMQERISDFILMNSEIPRERLKELMLDTSKMVLDVGTLLIGDQAVKEKLIDETGGLYEAMEKLYELIADTRKKKKGKKEKDK